jgi:hypothetical protein
MTDNRPLSPDAVDDGAPPWGPGCDFASCHVIGCDGVVHRNAPRGPGSYCAPNRCYCGTCPQWQPQRKTQVVDVVRDLPNHPTYAEARAALRARNERNDDR